MKIEAIKDAIFARAADVGPEGLAEAERWYIALYWFVVCAHSGGLYAFFLEPSGALWADAQRGLHVIGAKAAEDVLRRAIALFPDGQVPTDDAERQQALRQMPEQSIFALLVGLAAELHTGPDDVSELLHRHVAAHPELYPAAPAFTAE